MSNGIIDGNIYKIELVDVTLDLPSLSTASTAIATATIDGVRPEDAVFVNKPSHDSGLGIVNARVSADNTIEVTVMNSSGIELTEVAINLPEVAADSTAVATSTIAGLAVGDAVYVNKPSHSAGLGIVNARVSAADTLEVTAMNATGLAIDAASETYKVLIFKNSSAINAASETFKAMIIKGSL